MDVVSANSVSLSSGTVERDLGQLRETMGRVLGSVFFGTLLKTMRESKLEGPFGHGGRGEEIFAAQLHGVLAERAGSAMRSGLADALLNRLEHQQRIISEQRAGGTRSQA